MSYSLADKLVIGISARALFDMTRENDIYEKQGLKAYCDWQIAHEKEILKPGPGFELVKSLLSLNECSQGEEPVEVVLMSHNSPDISLRIFHSIAHYGLGITRAVFASGSSLIPYLQAFQTDLFLSSCEKDVQSAIDNGYAAGVIYTSYENVANVIYPFAGSGSIKLAFDADAVLFSDESERIFRQSGLRAFEENECRYVDKPLEPGPFAGFLKKVSGLRKLSAKADEKIRIALVTSRCAPAHERVIKTLRTWGVKIDEAFFLGGISKKEVLRAFGAQIFFDDQQVHLESAAKVVPVARVPYLSRKREQIQDEIQTYRSGEIPGTA